MKHSAHPITTFLFCLTFIILLFMPVHSYTEIMRVGVLDFPPYYIVKSENDVSGSMADVIRKTLDRAGIQYVVSGYPPKRLYNNLVDGITQIWLGIKGVPIYEGHVLYSKIQTGEIEIRLYTTDEKPLLTSLDELKGKKVIVIRGYGYGGMISFLQDPKNSIAIDEASGHSMAFKMLKKGRADYLLEYKQPAEEYIKQEKLTGLKYSPLKKLSLYFIVSKKTPDAENLLKKIDAAYLALKNEGAFNQ